MEKKGALYSVGGNVNWCSHYGKTVGRFLKKLKIELPYDPAIPLLGMYPKEMKAGSRRDIYTPMFTAGFFTIANIWKQSECLSKHEWVKKMWCTYIYMYNGILFSHKRVTSCHLQKCGWDLRASC